ncbi:MAG: 30S ribosomal protein S20 [Gammaproteobacteria bacterium]
MANTAQAKKRARQAEQNRQRNASGRSLMRTYIKKVKNAIDSGDQQAAQAAYREATALIDRTARKGLVHPNKAARHKSRLHGHIRALETTQP